MDLFKSFESDLLERHLMNHPFFVQLDEGVLPEQTVQRLAVELTIFYDRMFDVASAALSWQPEKKLKDRLSQWYVHMLRTSPEKVEALVQAAGIGEFQLGRSLPLAGTNALLNHMLFLSRNDPLAYVACLPVCLQAAFQTERVLDSLTKYPQYAPYLPIFQAAIKSMSLVQHPLSLLQHDDVVRHERRIKHSLQLLIETFSLFYAELLETKTAVGALDLPAGWRS